MIKLPDKALHSVVVIMIVTGSCKTFKAILESHTTSLNNTSLTTAFLIK